MELSARDELWLLRRQLDRMSNERLRHFFSAEEEETYDLLSTRELELIQELGIALDFEEEQLSEIDLTDAPAEATADLGDTAC